MAGNTFGHRLKLTTFGESHGKAIGGILDGFPAGISVDESLIRKDLQRRRPGAGKLVSSRNEPDEVELLSGIFDNKSLGSPIAFLVRNKDQQSKDYDHLAGAYRPSHADFTYEKKFGLRDYRGGGRASARETVARVVAGSFAKMLLNHFNVEVLAFVSQVSDIKMSLNLDNVKLEDVESSQVACPDPAAEKAIINKIEEAAAEGDTLGGVVSCILKNVPPGLGEPVFDKLHADLGKAMLSINAVKGFEIGSGFNAAAMKGSEHNDRFIRKEGAINTETNFSGGVQGGISNGMDIYFNVAFKPVATLMQEQKSVDKEGNEIILSGKGRHDVCVVPRAVPIVEAMAALVIADHFLLNRSSKL